MHVYIADTDMRNTAIQYYDGNMPGAQN